MAQTRVVSMPPVVGMAPQSREYLDRSDAYGQIVRLRDQVVSGSHPRIKVLNGRDSLGPNNLSASPASSSSRPAATSAPTAAATTTATTTSSAAATSEPIAAPAASAPPPTQPVNHALEAAKENRKAFQANALQSAVTTNLPGLGSLPITANRGAAAASGSTSGAAVQFNPIFLEKSDHLVKTEILMQRRRIERALKDQLEVKRNASWNQQLSESAPELDLVDVRRKALTMLQEIAPPSADANIAANKSDENDSVDENSFYSSHFDSPNSNHVARIPDDTASVEDVEMRESPDYEPVLNVAPAPPPAPTPAAEPGRGGGPPEDALRPLQSHLRSPAAQQQPLQPEEPLARRPSPFSRPSPLLPQAQIIREADRPISSAQRTDAGASDLYDGRLGRTVQVISSQGSTEASGSEESGNTNNEGSNDDRTANASAQGRFPRAFDDSGSTLVRAHDLSPLAPQPSHVSPLAISRRSAATVASVGEERFPPRGTPAQVSALRNEVVVASSPESSPQGSKATEKRNGKKKKSKKRTDRQAAEVYIKPEPRSPSPFSSMPAARPHKRLRPSQRSVEEISYVDAGGYRDPHHPTGAYRERYEVPAYRGEPVRVVYERREDDFPRERPSSVYLSSTPRFEPEIQEIRRPPTTTQFLRHPQSPGLYPVQYAPGEARPARSVSHALVDRPYREAPTIYYRDARDEPRMSVRPGADRERSRSPVIRETRTPAMAPPPRAQPTRIYLDEYGREFLEPVRPPSIIRQSVAPPPRRGEEIVYQQPPPPPRAPSRIADPYGSSIVYAHASPTAISAPRRVITEPEYVGDEYRAYRQRDYPVRQPEPLDDEDYYHSRRQAPERRQQEEAPTHAREYLHRSGSVRPRELVPFRHDVARGDYDERAGSVRPEQPASEYLASSAHPEARRELIPQPPTRDYSVRPEAATPMAQVINSPYSVRPVEHHQQPYYEQRPIRGDEEVMYIERPPQSQQGAPVGGGSGVGDAGGGGIIYSNMAPPHAAPHHDIYR